MAPVYGDADGTRYAIELDVQTIPFFGWRRMRDNMDINAGVIADGEQSVQEVGREIFDTVMKVASGERTCGEKLGHKEFVPWRIGPVL